MDILYEIREVKRQGGVWVKYSSNKIDAAVPTSDSMDATNQTISTSEHHDDLDDLSSHANTVNKIQLANLNTIKILLLPVILLLLLPPPLFASQMVTVQMKAKHVRLKHLQVENENRKQTNAVTV